MRIILILLALKSFNYLAHHYPADYVIMEGRYPTNVVLCTDAPVRTSPRLDNPPDYTIPAGTPLFVREVGRWSAYGWARIGVDPVAWIEMYHICEDQ